ncbi:MAG: NAD(P)-dependent oxidoreductase, partial [Vicingaceae bacterium]
YSVANKKSYQLKEVIQIFESISNKKINVVWGGKPYRKREVMNLWVNGDNLPNWKPKISLEEGLKLFK